MNPYINENSECRLCIDMICLDTWVHIKLQFDGQNTQISMLMLYLRLLDVCGQNTQLTAIQCHVGPVAM